MPKRRTADGRKARSTLLASAVLPGVWELPADDPRRIEFEKRKHAHFLEQSGRWTYETVQRFIDGVAAELGIRAPRLEGVATNLQVATPMGIPPGYSARQIEQWRRRAIRGEPIPWIVESLDGPNKGHKTIVWQPLPEASRRAAPHGGGAPRKLSAAAWRKHLEQFPNLRSDGQRAQKLGVSVATVRRRRIGK
jgi:hypothetical protein